MTQFFSREMQHGTEGYELEWFQSEDTYANIARMLCRKRWTQDDMNGPIVYEAGWMPLPVWVSLTSTRNGTPIPLSSMTSLGHSRLQRLNVVG
jgi:hypothetical protein